MEVTVTQKSIGRVAGLLGLFQGTAWVIISIICIVVYNQGLVVDSIPTSYMGSWDIIIYLQFLNKDATFETDYVASPTLITIFAWVYLIISALWIVVSILKLIAIHNNSPKIPTIFKTWGCVTLAIFVIDFILAILIGVDFNECYATNTQSYEEVAANIAAEGICTTIYIPVLVIVARGFVLMVVNFVFFALTLMVGKQLETERKAARSAARVTSNLYGNDPNAGNTIPRATVQSRGYGPNPAGGPPRNQAFGASNNNNNNNYPYSQNPPPQNWNGSNLRNGYNARSQPTSSNNYPPQQYQGRY